MPDVIKDPRNFPDEEAIPANYVKNIVEKVKPLPPVTWSNWHKEINWISVTLLTVTPILAIYGMCTTTLRWETGLLMLGYYFYSGLSITAGYHRLWSHRSYNGVLPLRIFYALGGAAAAEGSIRWWSRGHRAHHRYTDTELDPYNALRGFFYSHVGWMLFRPRRKPGFADISDLNKDPIVRWQHRNYVYVMTFMAFILPTVIAWYGWNDARGGFFYPGVLRLVIVHHSTFCVNSLAHWLGEATFDDKLTPKDHFITAFVTVGEGYHNFHHQFPMDYRNAIKWYQYDPTKWFIWVCANLGLASHLKMFPENEVRKGQLTIQLKRLRQFQEQLAWPSTDLPVVSWESFQKQAARRPLVLVSGFIHDVGSFIDEHPGGSQLLTKFIGKDATTAFFGGVYDHSNAAHNLLAMKRVGVLRGGVPHISEDRIIPPAQRLKIARYSELSSYSSSASESGYE
ncbi:hypothetical protein FISHEDRAFT_52032 [Fistulina hepatica ATCC 64428]|nr:hypothetical protein FISHEDRAFT_52032 [Fistulina hepatica ATCC 64428]